MVKEMKNYVGIKGLLSEIDLEEATYEKDGKTHECIRGSVKVRSQFSVSKEDPNPIMIEIPIRTFVRKYTNAGGENPSYANLKKVKDSGLSIAAVGEEKAEAVVIGGARVTMNEYPNKEGRLVTFPMINASFINTIPRNELKYEAKAGLSGVIVGMNVKEGKEGSEEPTRTLVISLMVVGYNEYVDVIPVMTSNPKYIDAILATYQNGDYIELSTRLNFSSSETVTYEEVEIGDPIEKRRTVNVSDLVLTGLKSADLGGDEIDETVIRNLLKKRDARIEELKNKKANSSAKADEERSKSKSKASMDLGF